MGTGSFPGVNSGRNTMLTPHLLLGPWSWKSRAIPLLALWSVRPVQSLSACTRVHYTFTFYSKFSYFWQWNLAQQYTQNALLPFRYNNCWKSTPPWYAMRTLFVDISCQYSLSVSRKYKSFISNTNRNWGSSGGTSIKRLHMQVVRNHWPAVLLVLVNGHTILLKSSGGRALWLGSPRITSWPLVWLS